MGLKWLKEVDFVLHVKIREAFKREKRKYIGLLPLGGYPPLARIGNFRFFLGLFSRGGGHNWEKIFIHFLHVLEHIDHF